jgi:transposase InsO family protein
LAPHKEGRPATLRKPEGAAAAEFERSSPHRRFYLYVILYVYSRYVVEWLLAERKSTTLADHLIAETCRNQDITRENLTLHADRGSAITSKKVAMLLGDVGVTKSHSRPYVSDENLYSEAQFKTLEYRPASRSASATCRTPGFSARPSLPGITPSTAIAVS